MIKTAAQCWTAGFVLYKFLPVSGVVQTKDDKEDSVEEYLRVLVNGNIVRIQENVPLTIPDSSLYHGE